MSANPHQSTPTYQRRRPELTSLYQAVAHHLPKLNDALDVFIDTLRYHYQRRCLPLAPHPPERYDIDDLNAYYSPRYPHDLGAITSVQRHTDAFTLSGESQISKAES